MYSISPKGNAEPFKITKNLKSETLEAQLSKGYILSYLYYDDGTIKYNGLPKSGRFDRDIDDKTLFFTHSTGKSIISYIVGHAICEGYISSVNEPINWPLMDNTLYDGQPLINLLNMNAGDKHTVNPRSSRVMGSNKHHRDMDHISIAELLHGTKRESNKLFYNLCLGSYSHKTMNYMREFLKRDLPMSFSKWEVFSLILDIKFDKNAKYNASYLQIPKSYLGYKLISKKLLDYCKKNGIKVHVWTINEIKEMKNLIGIGVDGIMTDNCRTLLDVLRKYKFFDKKIVLHPFLIT